jgi:hypothetical protein
MRRSTTSIPTTLIVLEAWFRSERSLACLINSTVRSSWYSTEKRSPSASCKEVALLKVNMPTKAMVAKDMVDKCLMTTISITYSSRLRCQI